MAITISAPFLPEEYIDILAVRKGYEDTILVPGGEQEDFKKPNPQSKEDFLRQVYDGMIKNDISTEIIKYNTNMKEAARIAEENAIREAVANAITSSVQ